MNESRKNERICVACHKSFWAWDSAYRDKCLQCEPMPSRVAKIVIRAIELGEIRL
jgi:hypothetical protein